MAVYKRIYRAYAGPVTPLPWRWLTITRFSLREIFSSRVTSILFVLCLVPSLVAAIVIYIVNSDTAMAIMSNAGLSGPHPSGAPLINSQFFFVLLQLQGWMALFLTAWIGPMMISPELTNGALPLFLSRPMSRAKYVGGKVLVLALVLSGATWAPLVALCGLQAANASAPWLRPNWFIPVGIFAGCALWIGVLSLVSLAVSAWVRWRIVAIGLTVAVLLVPAGFGGVISAVLRTKWGFLFNVPYLMTLIWGDLLHRPMQAILRENIPPFAAWTVLVAVCGASLLMLRHRIVARQVVRG
jgi:ABC-type transport system involved in multi-copper enzyme maturation permease subunit